MMYRPFSTPDRSIDLLVTLSMVLLVAWVRLRIALAVSLLALQTVNDLPGALIQMRRALAPDGLAVVALIGGDTLTELRQSLTLAESEILGGATPRVGAVRRIAGARRAGPKKAGLLITGVAAVISNACNSAVVSN